jgi:hypothetical protein
MNSKGFTTLDPCKWNPWVWQFRFPCEWNSWFWQLRTLVNEIQGFDSSRPLKLQINTTEKRSEKKSTNRDPRKWIWGFSGIAVRSYLAPTLLKVQTIITSVRIRHNCEMYSTVFKKAPLLAINVKHKLSVSICTVFFSSSILNID